MAAWAVATVPLDANVVSYKEGKYIRIPVAANTKIVRGAFVMIDGGYAKNLADAASKLYAGIAEETVDNSSGANGDKFIRVFRVGDHVVRQSATTGSKFAATDLGAIAYVDLGTNGTNGMVAKAETSGVKNTKVGRVVEYISADYVRISITGFAFVEESAAANPSSP